VGRCWRRLNCHRAVADTTAAAVHHVLDRRWTSHAATVSTANESANDSARIARSQLITDQEHERTSTPTKAATARPERRTCPATTPARVSQADTDTRTCAAARAPSLGSRA
jgi:hypothetical protein